MTSTAELECKKIFVQRCLFAVLFGIAIQYLLLTIFLLFVNFSVLHPIQWITEALTLVFSTNTWLRTIPLVIALVLYGIFLGNSFLAVVKYYPSRLAWTYGMLPKKFVLFVLHSQVGFLTAWLYSGFLSMEYSLLFNECYEAYCLNRRYIFLLLSGIYAGLYYFFKECFVNEPEIEFPTIQECKYIKIRSQLYIIIYRSLMKSAIPIVCFIFIYWLAGWVITDKIAKVLDVEVDQSFGSLTSIILNLRLLIYTWILVSQILCNMYLLNVCFYVALTTEQHFMIEKGSTLRPREDITLVEALSLANVPIARHLASLDFFILATAKTSDCRQQIFSLSVPGGHSYNWNQLYGQVLSMINEYTDELIASRKGLVAALPYLKKKLVGSDLKHEANHVLNRQYNESVGIRNMISPRCASPPSHSACNVNTYDKLSEAVNQFGQIINDACRAAFHSIPGLFYLFGEQEGAKTTFILAQSQDIIWLTQALAELCVASMSEDRHGVVQKELLTIIRSFLRLKNELDEIRNMNLNGKKINRNCIALRNAVKRSLYKIFTVFGDYAGDLITDIDELRRVQCYVNYLET